MKKIIYVLAIAATTAVVACGSSQKAEKNDNVATEATEEQAAVASESAAYVLPEEIAADIAAVEALAAEHSAEELKSMLNMRSYVLGANMGLSLNLQFADLNLDVEALKSNIINFYLNGDVEDVKFLEDCGKFQGFLYMRYMPYMRAKQNRQIMESAGMTENLPELPELFDNEYTAEFIANNFGSQMGASLIDVDGIHMGWFFKGFNDGAVVESEEAVESSLLVTIDEMQAELFSVQTEMIEKMEKKAEQKRVEAKERSAAWLAEIEKQEGVQKSASGLLYRIERKGNGEFPTADNDRVTVHYEGTLSTGEVFDSSYERGETITFGLNQVIKGWTEGLKLIDKGGEITLWIPSDLAYGEQGAGGGSIGPNEALKFKVELFGINE